MNQRSIGTISRFFALTWGGIRGARRRNTSWLGLECLEARRLFNAAPVISTGSLAVNAGTLLEGTTQATLSGQFTDTDTRQTHTVSVDWGDGMVTAVPADAGSLIEPVSHLSVRIDYTYDANNFFNTEAKKDLFQQAIDAVVSHFTDNLSAIIPSGGNSWNAIIANPSTGATLTISNPTVNANEILVYAGGYGLAAGQLAYGGPGGLSASGSGAWATTVSTRGQGTTSGAGATDFGPWGGMIVFNTSANFYFGSSISGIAGGQSDFYSVAMHEFSHLLGFGTSASWTNLKSGTDFTGAQSVAEHGGNVPLSTDLGHWADGTTSGGREAMMDPTLTQGTRKTPTALDFAGLDDIGWDYIAAPGIGSFAATHTYNDNGSYVVSVTLSDGSATDAETTSATVTNVAPTLTISSAGAVNEGSPLTLNLAHSDPGTDTITRWNVNWGDGNIEQFNSNPASVTHTYADPGTYSVSATATDEDGTFSSNTISQTVNNVAPALTTISQLGPATEDTGFTISYATLLAASNASDAGGGTLSFRVESVTSGTLTKNGIAITAGSTLLSTSESLVWTPAADANGSLAAFTVKAWDGAAASASAVAVAVGVTAVNDAPTLTSISTLAGATEDTPFTITYAALAAAANEADVDSGTLSFRVESVSSGTLTKNGVAVTAGSTLLSTSESLVWTPAADANGSLAAFTVKAWDGQDASTSAVAVNVSVTAVNDAPTLTTINTLTGATEDTPFTITYASLAAAANEADIDSATLSFRVEAVSSGTLTKNGVAVTAGSTLLSTSESLVWTPAADANGSLAAFTVTAWDGQDASVSPVSVNVDVSAVNDAPTLTSISTLTGAVEDTPFTITYATLAAAANEADIENATPSFRVESVSSGTLTKNGVAVTAGSTLLSTGESLVWTPIPNANGSVAAFTVKAWDGQDASASPVTVNVSATAVNDAPTLTSITTLTAATEDTPFTITYAALAAAANEADIDSATLSFRVEAVTSGTLTKNGVAVTAGSTLLSTSESLVWTPAADANGSLAAFTVTAWDGQDASASAVTVNVSVAAVNDTPTLTSINTLTGATEDTPFTITYAALAAAANEADIDSGMLAFRIESVTSGTLTKNGVAVTTGSTLLSTSESLVWTPAADANGSLAAFTVVASDGQLASATPVAVAVNVAAANDAPTLTTISALAGATEDTPFTITYAALATAANEADIDSGTLSFRVESVSSGTLTKNGVAVTAGSTLLSTSESLVWTPAADANGSLAAFTVKAWDGQDASTSAVAVNASVTAVNDAPTLTTINTLTGATEDTPFTITYATLAAAANETDIDSGVLSFRVEAVTTGTLTKNGLAVTAGSTLLSTGESLTWTPAADANGSLAAFTVKAWDGQEASASPVSVNVDVTAVNDGPTLTSISALTGATEDTPFTITYAALAVAANEADIDSATLSFRVEVVSSGTLTKNGVAVTAGSTLLSTGESLVWTPAADANGSLTAFTVKAWDGLAASVSAIAVGVGVTPVNDTPSFSKGADQAVNEDAAPQTIAGWATAISAGPGDESAQVLAFLATNDNNALFLAQPSILPNGTLGYSLAPDANGSATVTVSIQDNGGGADTSTTQTFTITVNPVNDAPTLTSITTLTGATEDTPFTITYATLAAAANEADIENATLSFRVESASSGTLTKSGVAVTAGSTLLSSGESLVWTPAAEANGPLAAFTVKAWDGQDASASAVAVNASVAAVNDTPSFAKGADQTVNEDAASQTVLGWATAISAGPGDESSQVLTFLVANDNNALFSIQPSILPNGTLGYSLTPDANGSATITASLQDNGGGADTSSVQPFTITVNAVNDAPTLTTISTLAGATEDTPFTITYATLAAAANEADIDSATLSFRVESVSSGTLTKNGIAVTAGSTLLSTGESLVWTPAANANGTLAAFTVKAWDGLAASISAVTVNVAVTAVNDTPSFSKGINQTVHEDAGTQSVPGWAAAISAGPGDESTQALTFAVTNDNNALFSAQPSILADGTLGYALTPDASGSATVTVSLQDNGGGADTSSSQTFTITVVAERPTLTFTKLNKTVVIPGTNLKLALKGSGTGMVWANEDGSIQRIELIGTDAKSSLTITPIDKAGVTRVDQIVVGDPSNPDDHTDLGTLSGKLIGLGDSLKSTGGIKSLTLFNVSDQHWVSIGSSAAIASTTVTLGTLTDVTFTSATPIKKFTAAAWIDTDDNDVLTAPWIGTLTIKGSMQADVTATSADAKGVAIGTYSAGTVGLPDVSDETDITVQSVGGVKTIKAAAWHHGTITAPWIGTLTIKGDMRADVSVTSTNTAGVGVGTYSAGVVGEAGDGVDVTLQNGGGIKTVKVADWLGGTITAGYVGGVTSSGNFGASLDLSDAAQKNTLAKLTVKGEVSHITVKSAGNIGAVTVGSSTDSIFFAGVSEALVGNPDSADDFTGGDFAIAGFTSKGAFSASTLAASRILKVSLAGVETNNGGDPFGLFTLTAPKSFKRLDTPGVKLLPLVSHPADLDPETGDDFGVFVL
ncbi:MAG: tandem-95 repeat protein [Planctomycetes bacterium]|nr:tandem-95 repeat protein [Planctomycetota bacterium]